MAFEPVTLDWNKGDVPILVTLNSMRGLYRVNAQGKVERDLVNHESTSDGGKTWKFELRSDVAWSDGVPLTAEHAAASLRRLLDPDTASTYAYFLYDIKGARAFSQGKEKENLGVRVTSELSFEVQLEKPIIHFSKILSHWVTFPVRPDLIAKWKDYGTNPAHMATLGPYMIKDWQHDIRIVLVPNPKSETQPWFQRVEAWTLPDDNTAINLYKTGHLELMTDPGQAGKNSSDLSNIASPILYFLAVAPGHPLTESREGVLALSAALDRSEIPQALSAPHRPTLEFCPPELWETAGGAPEETHLETISLKGTPALGRKLLRDAGFDSPAKIPPLTLKYFNRPVIKELAEWLQAQWKRNLGIRVSLEGFDPKMYWTLLERDISPPLFINSKGASYPDPDAFFRLFTSDSEQNLGHWKDTDYDHWVDEAASLPDAKARQAMYVHASRRLLIERPGIIPLYFRSTEFLIKPFVRGVVINPLTGVDLSTAFYEMPDNQRVAK